MLSLAVTEPGWVFREVTSPLQCVQQVPGYTDCWINTTVQLLDIFSIFPAFALFFHTRNLAREDASRMKQNQNRLHSAGRNFNFKPASVGRVVPQE